MCEVDVSIPEHLKWQVKNYLRRAPAIYDPQVASRVPVETRKHVTLSYPITGHREGAAS